MRKFINFWKVIVLDTLGIACMVLAILTGWLPGPGGIPLFLVGLGLLAVNHTWAERYIDLLKSYADKLGDLVFIKNPVIEFTYDVIAPLGILAGAFLLYKHSELWMISAGIFLTFMGITFLLGNRGRWSTLKHKLKHK